MKYKFESYLFLGFAMTKKLDKQTISSYFNFVVMEYKHTRSHTFN